jgi:hypothetical protein
MNGFPNDEYDANPLDWGYVPTDSSESFPGSERGSSSGGNSCDFILFSFHLCTLPTFYRCDCSRTYCTGTGTGIGNKCSSLQVLMMEEA